MEQRAKVWIPHDGELTPMRYEDRFHQESVGGAERIVVSAQSRWCALMLDIVRPDSGTVQCIYEQGEPGEEMRYESGELSFEVARRIVTDHSEFLELWPWHNFWMASAHPQRQVVLDEHNFLYVYGGLEQVVQLLLGRGFLQGPIELPTPHMHRHYPELEAEEPTFVAALSGKT